MPESGLVQLLRMSSRSEARGSKTTAVRRASKNCEMHYSSVLFTRRVALNVRGLSLANPPIHPSSPRKWGPNQVAASADFVEVYLGSRLRGNDGVGGARAYQRGALDPKRTAVIDALKHVASNRIQYAGSASNPAQPPRGGARAQRGIAP